MTSFDIQPYSDTVIPMQNVKKTSHFNDQLQNQNKTREESSHRAKVKQNLHKSQPLAYLNIAYLVYIGKI